MKPKKNPRLDLNKKRLLFFQIGLVLVLFISWRGIELKVYDKPNSAELVYFDDFPEEITPIKYEIEKEKTKEVQKQASTKREAKKAKDKYEVVPDDKKQILDSLYKPQTTPRTGKDIEPKLDTIDDYVPVAKIPFLLVQKSPVFPGCEEMQNNADRKACLNEKIHRFIMKNFDRDIVSELHLSDQILRTQVLFTLNSEGEIVEIQAKGPHPRLEKEAVRIIGMLPKISPGRHNGQAVKVLFSIPIALEVK